MRPELTVNISDLEYRFNDESAFTLRVGRLSHQFDGALGLYGLSGSGKTSFSRLLAGLIKPQKGSLRFSSGTDSGISPRIIYSPQFPEKILLGVRVRDTIQQIIDQNPAIQNLQEAIDNYLEAFLLDYDKIQAKSGYELSGGELRRLALALSFAMSPDLLILDEPTISMGYRGRKQLDSILEKFQEQHRILIVSHDFALIRNVCSRCWILHKGNLIFEGSWDELESRQKIKDIAGISTFERFSQQIKSKEFIPK